MTGTDTAPTRDRAARATAERPNTSDTYADRLEGEQQRRLDQARARLRPSSIAEIRSRKRQRRWLVKNLIAEDAYGVLGAVAKAGKTWMALDLAHAVTTGEKWLGRFEVNFTGPALYFLGEGGEQPTLRRLDSISRSYGTQDEFDHAGLHLVERVPHLLNETDMLVVREYIAEVEPVLVVVDPAYLAARGAAGSQLIEIGSALEEMQMACQDAGTALMVVHHWNKTGKGSGHERFSGSGFSEWGRFLISVDTELVGADELGHTRTKLKCEATLGEGPSLDWQVVRTLWADDDNDLNSDLHYELEECEPGSGAPLPQGEESPLHAYPRSLRAIGALGGWRRAAEVQEWDANNLLKRTDGSTAGPVTKDRMQKAMAELAKRGDLQCTRHEQGKARLYALKAEKANPPDGFALDDIF